MTSEEFWCGYWNFKQIASRDTRGNFFENARCDCIWNYLRVSVRMFHRHVLPSTRSKLCSTDDFRLTHLLPLGLSDSQVRNSLDSANRMWSCNMSKIFPEWMDFQFNEFHCVCDISTNVKFVLVLELLILCVFSRWNFGHQCSRFGIHTQRDFCHGDLWS